MENNKVTEAKLEKVHALINKLLSVTEDNGATEAEAVSAALKVQKILAKYDMELSDLGETTEDIIESTVKTSNDKWRIQLALIVAENFCTKVWLRGKNIIFYGYKRHTDIATEVYTNLYNFGRKRATEVFKEFRENGYNVQGIKNQFYIGYLNGIKSALDVQCRTLAIVTPTEVEEAYKQIKFNKRTNATFSYKPDYRAYDRGYNAGREAASRREIEG